MFRFGIEAASPAGFPLDPVTRQAGNPQERSGEGNRFFQEDSLKRKVDCLMKRFPAVAVVSFVLGVFGSPLSVSTQPLESAGKTPAVAPDIRKSRARIEIVDDAYDFGVAPYGETKSVTHTFGFRSVGLEDLVLTKIRPHCGCTSAIPSATRFAPETEGGLTAKLNFRGRSGPQSITVDVDTNDPNRPRHTFRIKGTILTPWAVRPPLLDFGDMVAGETKEQVAYVTSQYPKGEEIRKILQVRGEESFIQAATEDIVMPTSTRSEGYLEVRRPVRVYLEADRKVGERSGQVLVSTDDPENATLTIPLIWRVEGDLTVYPERVYVACVGGRYRKSPLRLSSRKGTRFEIQSVEVKTSEGPPAKLEVAPERHNTPTQKFYKVAIQEDPFLLLKPGSTVGEIVFKTTHPDQEEIRVPFAATIRN